jgi:hypothetical protein
MQLKAGLHMLGLTTLNNQFMAPHILSLRAAAGVDLRTVAVAALGACCLGRFLL